MYSRKAQAPSGASAASLVIVIVAFILIFILFIPPGERDELLNGVDDKAIVPESQRDFGVLLVERPGTITKLSERDFEHNIPSFNIYTISEDKVLKSVDSLFVESGGVSTRSVPIFLEKGADNGRLAFSVNDYSGRLAVSLNGEEIFRGDISSVLEPLSLGKLDRENVIEFSVDQPPAWKFWEKNFYELRSIKVTGTVEDDSNKAAVNTFFMSNEEADTANIDNAYIIYLVDCRVTEAGKLSVRLNGNLLSSKVPDCGSLEKTFIDPADFVRGKNELMFEAKEGRYLVDQVFVKTQLKKPIFPVYFFDLNESQFDKVSEDKINATIKLKFVNDDGKKNAVIILNDHRIFVDTSKKEFAKNIDPFVIEGSNFLRVEPSTTIHVTELSVSLDCQTKRDCS